MTLHGDKQPFWRKGGQQNFRLCPFFGKMDGGRMGHIFVYQKEIILLVNLNNYKVCGGGCIFHNILRRLQ